VARDVAHLDLGAYIAHGVVGQEAVVRFERGLLVKPLNGA